MSSTPLTSSNIWSLDVLKSWLFHERYGADAWYDKIFPQMQDVLVKTMLGTSVVKKWSNSKMWFRSLSVYTETWFVFLVKWWKFMKIFQKIYKCCAKKSKSSFCILYCIIYSVYNLLLQASCHNCAHREKTFEFFGADFMVDAGKYLLYFFFNSTKIKFHENFRFKCHSARS